MISEYSLLPFAGALSEQTKISATIEVKLAHAMPVPTWLSFMRYLTQQQYSANILTGNISNQIFIPFSGLQRFNYASFLILGQFGTF
jgi:hypothetical protein